MIIFPYLLGSLITILLFLIGKRFIKKTKKNTSIIYSQAYALSIVKQFIIVSKEEKVIKTQTSEYEKKMNIPVVLVDQQAYWIINNTLFVADEIDGLINKDSTRTVDTMSMDKIQLEKTMLIVEALTERAEDDNWTSRN